VDCCERDCICKPLLVIKLASLEIAWNNCNVLTSECDLRMERAHSGYLDWHLLQCHPVVSNAMHDRSVFWIEKS
jgi:hypothetical protein